MTTVAPVRTGRDAPPRDRLAEPGAAPRPGRRGALVPALLLLLPVAAAAIAPGLVAPFDPFANSGPALTAPGWAHPFGTDDLGRDLLSGVVYGARTSLTVAALATLLACAIGTGIGMVAGYFGGLIDDALMRFTEFVQVVPRFFVALLVLTLFGPSAVTMALVLGLMSWPGLARLTRAETLSLRGREFVRAAEALGGSPAWILRRHLLPHVQRPVLAVAAPVATGAILTEAGLSYLGLSDPNAMSWGKLIQTGQAFYTHGWWLPLMPGAAIVVTCFGLALLVEGLRPRF
ncbi:ABC transporter permease subunit [Rhodobacteraceae bacterium 2CG4]|uniref:ABC transporter permease subunit n=1 Tax=Halovulum marinum TaxID=2662447 RepID=A0A6L5Z557_9RHOB|nr:ABC transporter permease [Halovulum marinum]MSU91235.1 ABC transporter permease subunit [Halovulum marinum]